MNIKPLVKKIVSFLSASKILNNMPDMVLFIDFDGIIKEANSSAKENFGIIENITINEIFNEGLESANQSAKFKKSVVVKSKTNKYYEFTASKIGRNYCVNIRDNSKIINDNLEKEGIEKFNNEKNVFLVKLENEIKAPLNSITGFSQGLIDGIGGEITPKQSKYLKIIQSNAKDITEFIDKLLEFSYVESLFYKSDYKKFDIVSEIKDILKNFDKNIIFSCENFDRRNIYNDYNAINKSLYNILENLSKHNDGNIQIILSYPDDEAFISYGLYDNKKYLKIDIKDSNTIIKPEEIKQICNPYAQVDKDKKQIVKSLRLGIVSILIKRINGFFSINSDNGNLYSIIIPIEKEEDE